MEIEYIRESSKKDIMLLLRDYTVIVILVVFIAMSIASCYIGWSAQHIVNGVYSETAKQLALENKPVPPSPFSIVPQLALLKNMIIYVVLIGSLLAIILGHALISNDRKNGISKVLFSKPFSRTDYLAGKLVTASVLISIILLLSMIANIIFVSLLSRITLQSIISIVIFYIISFFFLSGFIFIGMYFSIRADNSTQAILLPIIIWIVIIFVIPELGSALYPTSSLNPVLPDTNILGSPILVTIHSVIYPFSVSEQYKALSATNLGISSGAQATNTSEYPPLIQILIIIMWMVVTVAGAYIATKRFDPSLGEQYE